MVDPKDLSIQYTHLPISSFSGWDRVWQVEAALNLHDHGLFRDSALLMDAMMRDDRIGAASDTRIAALLSCPIEYKPADSSRKAAKIADEIGGDVDEPGLHARIFPPSQMGELAWWGRFLGFGIGEIIWTRIGEGPKTRWMPRVQAWHPQFIYWDWSTFCYVVICAEGTVYLPDTDKEVHSNGQWFIYTPMGYRWGWLKGLVRRLAHKYIMRGWDYRDWSRYNERHGMPIIKAMHPPSALKADKDRFIGSVANIGSDAVVPLPQAVPANDGMPEQPGYDIELVEAQAKTHETFLEFKQELDSDITTAILGQDVTTSNAGGGSLAKAQVADRVTIDKRKEDATIADAFRDQVLWWYAQYNYGDGNLAPIPTIQVEPPEDETEEGQALLALGNGVQALVDVDPDGIDVPTIWNRFGIPVLSDEEREKKKQERIASATAALHAQAQRPNPGNDNGGSGGGGTDSGDAEPKQLSAAKQSPRVVSRYKFQGIDVAIENPKGSHRTWTQKNSDGTESIGTTEMLYDYGFIEGQLGSDSTPDNPEELDCYVGPDEAASDVYVVHQRLAPNFDKHDEDKVFLGFGSADAAKAAYLAHRGDDGEKAFGSMSVIPLERFKSKLARRTQSTRPIRATVVQGPYYVSDIERMLVSMVSRAEALKTGRRGSPKANRRAKLYGDRVADRAIKMAAGVFAPDLVGLREDLEAATDYDDLRKRVIARFKGKMDPQRLASIVEKARLMAHLGGRLAAIRSL
ncbi:MAG TPA: DUF935 family protein [Polyangia bacterium]|nr:DUF935 family protein [Polyangia bacterium]